MAVWRFIITFTIVGMLYGIENKLEAPEPVNSITYNEAELKTLLLDLLSTIRKFESSDIIVSLFPSELLIAVKKQEAKRFAQQVTNLEYLTYLQDV